MPDLVEAAVEDDRWHDAGLEEMAETACAATLAELGIPAEGVEIGLLGCDDARIAALNAGFRGRAQPTNVLSWPAAERAAPEDGALPALPGPAPAAAAAGPMPEALGDIAIAFDTCAREAAAQGKPFRDHCLHLLVHGCLHLLGFDHMRPKDAALMEGLELRILARLGVPDPY
jgi:probable rRNA maturation factor